MENNGIDNVRRIKCSGRTKKDLVCENGHSAKVQIFKIDGEVYIPLFLSLVGREIVIKEKV